MSTMSMLLKNDNREELMLLVSMQALVRGTLIRKSLMELRAEFEEINKELEGGASARVSTDWPANTPCRPRFKSAKEDSDILQRLAEKGWCKLQPSHQSEQSGGTKGDAASQQYSSDFQSRSSSSSLEESVQSSSVGSSLPPGAGAEGDRPSAQSHSENSHVDYEGLTDVQSPVTSIKETTENTQPLEQTINMREQLKENPDASKSFSSARSDRGTEPNGERESPFKSGHGVESISAETLDARGESERSRGTEEDEDHAPVRGGYHGEKMMHRQSLNETEFTLVSSVEASSVHLSSLDDESVSGNAVLEDERLEYGGVETTSKSEVMEDLDQDESELGVLLSSTSLGDQSSSNQYNGSAAADVDAKRDGSEELDSEGQEDQIRQRSSAGHNGPQQSSPQRSKADSSPLVPVFHQSSNGEGQALHSQTMSSLPHDEERPSLLRTCSQQTSLSQGNRMESKGSKHVDPKQKQSTVTSEGSIGRSLGAMGVDPDHSRQSSMQDDHRVSDLDASVAADMTSIWSTDLSGIDDEQVPQRDEAKLKEMRNNMAMELLWIQQAIESRKNYLRLKSKMTCSDATDQ
ncbi:uncharacterized protein LOC105442819 [Strongylocentrotus purpuratus]|uniref:Uncharacterized protein n=1 Tax=Strongylocentrotus purpuratus TaxID=7668 RepID=A0A7M7N3T8_STRPU|nr:uncharacterized protein LOC105442819 [Strongylocentrotus purpuratus]